LVNQYKTLAQSGGSKDPNYCVRVTANDGEIGEQFLREFQDNEKTIPTILTTSQKLSTGVDARNIRNIVLLRPVTSMIEFKQIVGRGTRLFEGKDFFTIYDFVDAYRHFSDPEWDGDPLEPEVPSVVTEPREPYVPQPREKQEAEEGGEKRKRIKVKLRDGKEREIQHMMSTSFWSAEGRPISAEEFLHNLFGELPKLFSNEAELRRLWSNPLTRRTLLEKLAEAGFGKDELGTLQQLIDAEKSDLFDVLEYVFNSDIKPMTRAERVAAAQATIFALLNDQQKEFIEFVLSKYIETGVEELDQEKLPLLLVNKYQSLQDAKGVLGEVRDISALFVEFQKYLYEEKVA
jgi:type I restriction enzyme R subunit